MPQEKMVKRAEGLKEIWKKVPEFCNYYSVSNTGFIRIERKKNKGSMLKPWIDHKGYYIVGLISKNNRLKIAVHRIVMRAFIGKVPNGMEVNHLDGNKSNNNLNNLEYVTSSQNKIHAYRIGLMKPNNLKGERISNKLKNIDVLEIRRSYIPRKISLLKLSLVYGVSPSCIASIIKRKTWKHV